MKNRREVRGYGFAELGVEWGYEYDDKGGERIYVMDCTGVTYVDTEIEAEALCRANIERWSPC